MIFTPCPAAYLSVSPKAGWGTSFGVKMLRFLKFPARDSELFRILPAGSGLPHPLHGKAPGVSL